MKITINTDVLKRHGLSLGEFLIMLLGFYDIDYKECHDNIIKKSFAENNLFKENAVILSDNNKTLVARVLMESDDKAIQSGIDFDDLASKLQKLYPEGFKAGTTQPWRSNIEEIAFRLCLLIVKYDFKFTTQEAINAVEDYVSNFKKPYENMLRLKHLIYKANYDVDGNKEMSSLFMTIIENKRLAHENTN